MPEVVQIAEEQRDDEKASEGSPPSALPRTTWSGSLRIGLVNIPVKALSLIRDRRISFRMLHKSCKTPISFKRICQEGEEVSMADIIYGYPLDKSKYVLLEKKEIESARPDSKNTILLDRFVNFFEIDPHYFDTTYLLLPDRSEEAYSLMRAVMEKSGRAGLGKITFRSKERLVLVHYYRGAIVATTLRYDGEIMDPHIFPSLQDLAEPGEKELDLAIQIIESLSGELDLTGYKDQYREKIEALVKSKMEGTVIIPEKKRARPPAKSLMDALRQTAESLKK
ncbi:MAG: Ku protein [Methanothrix sp.]|nr:Ku protein [Methanothrix sp.]